MIISPGGPVSSSSTPHWSARLVAWCGFIFGSAVSIAANVISTWLPVAGPDGRPVPRPEGWTPELAPQAGAAVWSIALLVSVEVLTRVPWPHTPLWVWARYLGTGAVAAGSAVISYSHMRDVLLSWGYHWWAASVGPIVVDGLMTVSGFALLAMSRAADRVPVVQAVEDQAVGPVQPELSGPVQRTARLDRATRTGPVRARTVDRRTSRRTTGADRSADHVARSTGPAPSVAAPELLGPVRSAGPVGGPRQPDRAVRTGADRTRTVDRRRPRAAGPVVRADRSAGPDLVVAAPVDEAVVLDLAGTDRTGRRTSGPVREQRTSPVRPRVVDRRTTRSGPDGPDPAGGRAWTGDALPTGPRTTRTGPGQAAPTAPTGPDRTERTTETRTGPRATTGPGRTTRTTPTDDLLDVGRQVLGQLEASGARISRRSIAAAIRERNLSISTQRAGDLLRQLTEVGT